jgi:beta-galactosidase
VPTANHLVKFELTGPGAIIGVGNGNPLCHEPEKGNQRSLYNGLAQVIIQTKRGTQGTLQLKATADGLKPADLTIAIDAAK